MENSQKRTQKCMCLLLLTALLAMSMLGCGGQEKTPVQTEAKPEPSVQTGAKPEPVEEPATGTVLSGYAPADASKISVTLEPTGSSVVMLKDESGRVLLSFYVRSGESATVDVPAEKMYVHFASGTTWYGEDLLFGEDTIYREDKELTDFAEYSWEYELDPMESGELVYDDTEETEEQTQPAQQDPNHIAELEGEYERVHLNDGSSSLDVTAQVYSETIYNCREMTVNMLVEMKKGTHCKDWQVWGRNEEGRFKKIGKIYLPDGDGYISETIQFEKPVSFDAIAITPTVPGGYSWSLAFLLTDIYMTA